MPGFCGYRTSEDCGLRLQGGLERLSCLQFWSDLRIRISGAQGLSASLEEAIRHVGSWFRIFLGRTAGGSLGLRKGRRAGTSRIFGDEHPHFLLGEVGFRVRVSLGFRVSAVMCLVSSISSTQLPKPYKAKTLNPKSSTLKAHGYHSLNPLPELETTPYIHRIVARTHTLLLYLLGSSFSGLSETTNFRQLTNKRR